MSVAPYIKTSTRLAEDKDIKHTIYEVIKLHETLGNASIDYRVLTQRVQEGLEEKRLDTTPFNIVSCIDDMIQDDLLYRVTSADGIRIGLT